MCAGWTLFPSPWILCSPENSLEGAGQQAAPAQCCSGKLVASWTSQLPFHVFLFHLSCCLWLSVQVHRDHLNLDSTVSNRVETLPPNMLLFFLQVSLKTLHSSKPKPKSYLQTRYSPSQHRAFNHCSWEVILNQLQILVLGSPHFNIFCTWY